MPLLPGKSAFSHNIKAEIAVGKPQKQAVAIAYSKLDHKSEGGDVEQDPSNELLDQVAGELLQAIETKDKSLLVEALTALCMHLQDESNETQEETI